jgi:phage portal protein BeeE
MKKKTVFQSREVDFSSEESKERIKKVLEKQKLIRESGKPPTLEQIRKITFTI